MAAVKGSDRPANFTPTPSLWGDQFINHVSNPQVKEKYSMEIEGLKNEVTSMVTAPRNKIEETMSAIDAIERLGVSYHFKNEIEDKVQQLFDNYEVDESYDLYTLALHFRLFRQHGHPISSDTLGKWMDDNGKFQERVKSDAKGLLSLYEASYLRTHGETLLDKALDFATTNLKLMAPDIQESPLRKQVEHALIQSLHFGIPRLEARHFISIYDDDEQHKNETLLRFAKLDFNLLQILHKEELCQLSRWWKELDLISKLPYARDRMVEIFFWTVGVFHEPQYSRARIMLAKSVAMVSVLDDTFDSYGTIQELEFLNRAIQRWDIKEIDGLPEYIKSYYEALLKLYQQLEQELAEDGRAYATYYAIEAFKESAMSYYVEAKWFIQEYMPPFEEYLNNALITGGSKYLNITSLMGMEHIIKEDFEWLSAKRKMFVATQTITRLIDDVASYEVEKERGQDATGIDCFMKEQGVTKEEAMNKFLEMTTNAWKVSNEECLGLSSNSRDVFMILLNFNRIIDVTYKNNEDGYTHPHKVLKPHIIALLVDQIQI